MPFCLLNVLGTRILPVPFYLKSAVSFYSVLFFVTHNHTQAV
ncbi:hypothetical protein X73_01916 [Pasteurella multocida subsp. gallicida X73]|nr:hypothetical protein X73_01916 [Pasteurella multocida subsp. gallicida X73]